MSTAYINEIRRLLDLVEESQSGAVHRAASCIAEAFIGGQLLHLFGTGHAHILCEELFYRAGGMLPINPIFDSGLMLHESALASSQFERLPGYAHIILSRHTLEVGDVMLIASNSGVNAVPVEAALEARERGLSVIALTSLAHSQSVQPRHASCKKLYQLADVVIDNCGQLGDAALEVPGLPGKVEATSTVTGAVLLHWVMHEVIEQMLTRGVTPEIIISANVPGGDQHNAQAFAHYRNKVRSL